MEMPDLIDRIEQEISSELVDDEVKIIISALKNTPTLFNLSDKGLRVLYDTLTVCNEPEDIQ